MAKKKKQILLKVVILMFTVGIISTAVYWRYRQHNYLGRITAEFKRVENNYPAKMMQKNDLSVRWVSLDNLNIINDDSSGVELDVRACLQDNDSRVFNKLAQDLGVQITKIMQEAGFKKNQLNSSNNIKDQQFYDYVQAYENEIKKCVLVADPDCSSAIGDEQNMHYTFSFACTQKFDENYRQQAQLLKDLNIKDAIIHIQKQSGDFLMLNVNYRRSGHYTIAKKVNGRWIEVHSGQDLPPCDVIKKYQVPKEISADCW